MVSGADVLTGAWSVHQGNIHKAAVELPVEQLFIDGRMMMEARWPNTPLDDIMVMQRAAAGGEAAPAVASHEADWKTHLQQFLAVAARNRGVPAKAVEIAKQILAGTYAERPPVIVPPAPSAVESPDRR